LGRLTDWKGAFDVKIPFPLQYCEKEKCVSGLSTPLHVSFRRALVGDNGAKWLQLVESILNVRLGEQTNTFIWTKSNSFSVKAMYNDLVVRNASRLNLVNWKAKIP
jgi:hypothetical protein